MNVVSPLKFPAALSPGSELVLLYRRICLLRATNQLRDAEQLQAGEFSRALAAVKESAEGANPGMENQLQALFTAEEERVANASVLATLLVPLLGELLRPATASPATALAFEPRETGIRASSKSSEPSQPAPLSVADFIEGMLSQDRAHAPRHAS